jgi:hypothetical protein
VSAPTPFFKGKDVTLIFLRDSKKVEIKSKSIEVTLNSTDSNDGVNGEDRDRLQSTPNFFEIQIEAYMEDCKELQIMMDEVEQIDTRTQPLEKGVAMLVRPNNGTKYAAEAQQVSIGAWSWSISGRTENSMLKIPMRARYFRAVPTI